MTGVLDQLRARRAEIEDEIGRLEDERARAVAGFDRDIKALRAVLSAMSDAPVSKGKRHRDPTPPRVRAARALLQWPEGEPITSVTLYPKMGLRQRDQARRSLQDFERAGIVERGPDLRTTPGSPPSHAFEIRDREALERLARV